MSVNLITFHSESDSGTRLVGIGITDEIIEYLKKNGGILEDSARTGADIDVVVLYSPTLNELMKTINSVIPKDRQNVRFL